MRVSLVLAATLMLASSAEAGKQTWTFERDKVGSRPAGFSVAHTGAGKEGAWQVRVDPAAPGRANVLAQTDSDTTDDRFLVAVPDGTSATDGRLTVRCKMVSGTVDQACGLVFRYRDSRNYYVTRANALEGNVRLYFVKGGVRKQIASWTGKVTAGAWHTYAVEFRGPRIRVSWDGAGVLDHRDQTFPGAGKVGLWTKADSVTYFDDLSLETL